jgi:hypothetical protein
MIKCIVCAERKNVEKAFTCSDCTQFLNANGFVYGNETIEIYQEIVASILARNENSEFLYEIVKRRQDQKQSVLDAIAKVIA